MSRVQGRAVGLSPVVKVTVVVPCFDVEAYVDDCIRSVIDQTHLDLEIIAIDDGSTDRTGLLLDAWALRDDRLTVQHQANRGLGAARNAGTDLATGDALFFLDGDDFLPPGAIEGLVASLSATSSELAAGVIEVWRSGETWRATQQRTAYDTDRRRSSISELPDLVYDSMVCSKLFRTSLWRRLGLRFREGVLFEDADVAMQAYCGAAGIDVMASTAYFWRRRESGDPSITQRVTERAIADRFDALLRAHRCVIETCERVVVSAHAEKLINIDVRRAVRQGAATGPAAMNNVVAAVRPVVLLLSARDLRASPPMMRVVCNFIVRGDDAGLTWCERCFGAPDRSLAARAMGVLGFVVRRPIVAARLGGAMMARASRTWVTPFRDAKALRRRRP